MMRISGLVLLLTLAGCAEGPQPIRITGSSTVFPFTKAVADAFVKAGPDRPRPLTQPTGTGPGIAAFCGGKDAKSPDLADASRRMTRAEYDGCRAHGVGEVIEVRVGLDGIAVAQPIAGPPLRLARKDIYLALAANPEGKPNAARTWKDVNASLPATPIKVLGPPKGDGTYDQFIDLLMEPGCLEANTAAKALQQAGGAPFDAACRTLRTDGVYVPEGEDDAGTARRVEQDPQALGLFGYSYLERSANRLRGIPIDGVAPSYAAISAGKYPGARTLFLYVNKQRLKSNRDLQAFLDLYAAMWNPDGPLTKLGLIAMSAGARERSVAAIKNGEVVDREALF